MPSQPPRQDNPRKTLHGQGLAPKKHFGQNFLVNMGVVAKMTAAADLSGADVVLEVGPGLGALTRELAWRVKKVIAVEKDRSLAGFLTKELPGVDIVEQDILKFPLEALPPGYKVVASIPFAITAPLIRKLLETENPPLLSVLLVQKEVAQRILAKPPRMNLLAVSVQFYAQASIVATVKKGVFWPQPKVDAAILKLVPFGKKPEIDPALFFPVVKAGFLHPRKQLLNNIREGLGMKRQEAEQLL
ncbi:MAG: ribosomal RNA small subunit methyltransferase A, partial [Parcubacteria group bacterium]|nr:ribosomal RNA small subunit methyltransferase A [Parcubacteria group bacterium]